MRGSFSSFYIIGEHGIQPSRGVCIAPPLCGSVNAGRSGGHDARGGANALPAAWRPDPQPERESLLRPRSLTTAP